MSIESLLSDYDLTQYSVRYCLVYEPIHIDETYEIAPESDVIECLRTRCMISYVAMRHLLCTEENLEYISIDDLLEELDDHCVYSFTLSCSHVDHIFLCIRDDSQWKMIASYAYEYPLCIRDIDISSLLMWIRDIQDNGIDFRWKEFFACSKGCEHSCIPRVEIYKGTRVDAFTIHERIKEVNMKVSEMIQDEDSYIHSDEYSYLVFLNDINGSDDKCYTKTIQ